MSKLIMMSTKLPKRLSVSRPLALATAFVWALVAMPSAGVVADNRPVETTCRPWVAWHIDTVDPRFGLSLGEVARAAEEAAGLWNRAAQRELFQQVERQGIAVNLTYDHRQAFFEDAQQLYQQIERLREQIASEDEALGVINERVNEYVEDIESLNTEIRNLSAEANNTIEQHRNRRRQVPAHIVTQVNEIRAQQQQLNQRVQAKIERYNSLQEAYNERVAERNVLALQHGELASQLNAQLAQQRGAADVGEHGIYIRSQRGRVSVLEEVISVYQVRSWQGLVTILAHEFGHAIGIGHVNDAQSIMSARIESQLAGGFPEQLSQADIAALHVVCDRAMRSRR